MWGYDQSSLAAANGGNNIKYTCGETLRRGFKGNAAVGIDGLELLKVGELECFLRSKVIDGLDFSKLRATRTVLAAAVYPDTCAQTVFADEVWRYKDVFLALGEIFSRHSQKAEAFGGELKHAIHIDGISR